MQKKVIIGIFGLLVFASCGKFSRNATIERDCTGTYLEINNKDYLVCNPSILSSYPDGSSIEVKYRSVSDCTADSNVVICELYHKNNGTVEITEVK